MSNGATTPPSLSERLDALATQLDGLTKAAQDSAQRTGVPGAAPHARRGEDPLSSRGYSFARLFQHIAGHVGKEEAKVEIDLHNRLQKNWYETHGYVKSEPNSIMAPVGSELLPQGTDADVRFVNEIRQMVRAGTHGADPYEVRRIAAIVNKDLSWNDETALGALVAPPQYGELIDLLRNNEVFAQAGASMIGMPPNGRMVIPRQTGASTAYYIGESTQITDSQPSTGDVFLTAKKVAALIKVPNELFRYASVAVEAFLRNDLAKVLALRMDKELLEGVGSSVAPKGLINYSGIGTHTSGGTPADAHSGYPFQPEDVAKIIAKVEEKNAQFKSWVMRPLMWSWITNRRADAVSANDAKGPFMFNVWRGHRDGMDLTREVPGVLSGYPVYKSTQLSNTRTRGNGTTNNTYILGGDFADYIIAVSPTIEFAQTQFSDTAFQNDQTWLRAILPHDGAPRREASFILCDQLLY